MWADWALNSVKGSLTRAWNIQILSYKASSGRVGFITNHWLMRCYNISTISSWEVLSPGENAYLANSVCILPLLAWPDRFPFAWLCNELDAWPAHLLQSEWLGDTSCKFETWDLALHWCSQRTSTKFASHHMAFNCGPLLDRPCLTVPVTKDDQLVQGSTFCEILLQFYHCIAVCSPTAHMSPSSLVISQKESPSSL